MLTLLLRLSVLYAAGLRRAEVVALGIWVVTRSPVRSSFKERVTRSASPTSMTGPPRLWGRGSQRGVMHLDHCFVLLIRLDR